jgi:hypothetical protein
MAGLRFTRIRRRVEDDVPEVVETDDDVRRAMARISRYGGGRPLERREPAESDVHPLGQVISLWPR